MNGEVTTLTDLVGHSLQAFEFAGNPLMLAWITANTAGSTKKAWVLVCFSEWNIYLMSVYVNDILTVKCLNRLRRVFRERNWPIPLQVHRRTRVQTGHGSGSHSLLRIAVDHWSSIPRLVLPKQTTSKAKGQDGQGRCTC